MKARKVFFGGRREHGQMSGPKVSVGGPRKYWFYFILSQTKKRDSLTKRPTHKLTWGNESG